MSESLLNILKYFLIALLWLFFLRVLRVAWIQMSESRQEERHDAARAGRGRNLARAALAAPPIPPPPSPGAPGVAPGTQPVGPTVPSQHGGPNNSVRPPSRVRVVEPAEVAGLVFILNDELVLGRSRECGASLARDNFVSNRHARIYRNGADYWVEDLGSTNGTYLNAQRLEAAQKLSAGDRVQVGRTTLEAAP
ncbi:MAG: FHA domain-containing protein [Acidimicrobiales bacterium]